MEELSFRFLIDFEAIVDIELGILKFLTRHSKFNKKYFKPNMISGTDAYFKNIIVSTKKDNILEELLLDEYINNASNIYSEIMNKYEEDILLESELTDIYKLSNNWMAASEANIKCVANCRTDIQYKCLSKVIPEEYTLVKDNYDMESYSNIIINRIPDILLYEQNLKKLGKSIFYIDRAVNFRPDGHRLDLLDRYFPCSTKAIDMYVNYKYMRRI